LAELRRFTLDVINTYGHVATPFSSAQQLESSLAPPMNEQLRKSDIVDVTGGSFSESSVPDGIVPLVMTFLGSQNLGKPQGQP
jgi:hypothetical protein